MMQMNSHKLQTETAPHAPTRVILLGASNLTRGLPTLFHTAKHVFNTPIHMHAAIGHGRSYGKRSSVLVRTLPGILESELWPALEHTPPAARTVALVSDIGNDILYGIAPETLLDWINTALDQLEALEVTTAITTLPIASIQKVPRWQAHLAKLIAYPGRGPSIRETIKIATQIDTCVRDLAETRNLALIEQHAAWYGFDPIHITAANWSTAAQAMFAPLVVTELTESPQRPPLRLRLRLRTARPRIMKVFGLTLTRTQPACVFADDSTLSLY